MNCMKCGREIKEPEVFCENCLAGMKEYPVKPGTVVQLPRRKFTPPVKKLQQKRKILSAEEQVLQLRKRSTGLTVALVLCLAALIGLVYLTVRQYLDQETVLLPGQNYSAAVSTTDSYADADFGGNR